MSSSDEMAGETAASNPDARTEEIRRAAFGILCIGFSPEAGQSLEVVPPEVAELIRCGVQGAILFRRNIESPLQTIQLVRNLKAAAGTRPFFAAVDQEGGRVARLRGKPYANIPPMRTVGETGDEDVAYSVGRALAESVRLAGFDVDFAPDMDVDTNPDNPVIGDRSFGRDPELVGRMGVALARGLEDGGVASCAKHFPGHGDTMQDSHLTLPRLPHGLDRLREIELPPFRRYAAAGLASVMSAHVVFEAADPGIPATFSRRIQTGILREELGFQGLLVCDDLEMNAVAEKWSIEEAAVASVRAGVDLLLICHHSELQRRAAEALTEEALRDGDFCGRLLEAKRRVDAFAGKWAQPVLDQDVEALKTALEEAKGGREGPMAARLPGLLSDAEDAPAPGADSHGCLPQGEEIGMQADPTEAFQRRFAG